MKSRRSLFLRVFVRLGLGLVLLVGLSIALGGLARPAYAAKQLTIANCRNDKQLQNAITTANKDNAGDTITFKCSGVILLSKTLTITGSTTLNGSGQTVTLDGNNSVKVLSVSSGVSFTLNALTIAHGLSPISSNGGGLENFGTVSISNSTFANNSALANGGGLENTPGSTASISNSTFANNSTVGAGGGLVNQGTVSISNSTFASNSANFGGGLENVGIGTVSISNSTFANNSTHTDGGGLENNGTVTISNSTFSGNSAGFGGGLVNGGKVSISNSTIANNSATGTTGNSAGFGGGLYNLFEVSISNSTFANNSAISGGGLYNNGTPPVTIGGSIVANNTANNCAGGGLSDQGYNLESGTDCGFMGTGDLQNTDPMLNGLGSNGGPTQTMALQQGSLAIDHVPLANCPSTDQRGNARPDDSSEIVCDIGAYESSF